MTSNGNSQRRGAVAAVLALLCIAAATLPPLPQQKAAAAITPLWCLVCGEYGGVDVVLNIILFIPLGIALRVAGADTRTAWLAGTAVSLVVEGLQLSVLPGRDASLSDLLTNSLGSWLGAVGAPLLTSLHRPTQQQSRRLLITSACLWLGLQVGTAVLLRPWVPPGSLRAEWSPRVPGRTVFDGRVTSAILSGSPVSAGTIPQTSEVIRRLQQGHADLRLRLLSGAGCPRWSTVFELRRSGDLVLAVDAMQDDLTFRSPSRSSMLRLRRPALRLSQALACLPGTPTLLSAGHRNDTLWASWTTGTARRRTQLAMSPSFGWSLLLPFAYAFGPEVRMLTALWITALLMPMGFWTARSGYRAVLVIAALAALVLIGLGLVPLILGYPAVHWTEWLAAAAGLAAGYAGHRFAAYYGW